MTGYTMAWKLYTPSISKKDQSVYWNWSNKRDGVRIMEVFCSDLTGHPSYIIMRITRNTEEECRAEFSGQCTDGYFENYRGDVKGKEIEPYTFSVNIDNIRKILAEQSEIEIDENFLDSYERSETISLLCAIMRGLGFDPAALDNARCDAEQCRRNISTYWEPDKIVTDEEKKAYSDALETLRVERNKALNTISNRVNGGGLNG